MIYFKIYCWIEGKDGMIIVFWCAFFIYVRTFFILLQHKRLFAVRNACMGIGGAEKQKPTLHFTIVSRNWNSFENLSLFFR